MPSTYSTTNTTITFRVPVACDLATMFDQGDRCYAAYLLDTIYRRLACWKGDDGYVRLNWKLLAKYIPTYRLSPIIDTLACQGVIEVTRSYSAGSYCKGYRLTLADWQATEYVCQDKRLTRKLREYWQEQEAKLKPVHKWLRAKFSGLTIDAARASCIISTLEPKDGSSLTTAHYRQLLHESLRQFAGTRKRLLSRDDYGRVHTPLTNLPKQLRCCLRVDGDELEGVDIANSQPLFCAILAQRYLSSKNTRDRLITRSFEARESPYVTQEYRAMAKSQLARGSQRDNPRQHPCNMCPISSLDTGIQGVSLDRYVIPADVSKYQALCEQGLLYEFLTAPGQERKEVKQQLFKDVFFGHPGVKNRLTQRFAREFPNINRILVDLKTPQYQHLAHLLQSYESTLVIAIICQRIKKECPEIPLFTIHDSLLTTPPYVDYVKEVMGDEFAQIGVQVPLKEESYGSTCAA